MSLTFKKISKQHNIILNVDNCFATPFIQRPIEFGAHLVTHSATKYIDGQGRVLGGLVLGKKELIKEIYTLYCIVQGRLYRHLMHGRFQKV